ncbi:hypothetical protein PN36_10165 [Candidatus Thiomargarita nelsonii]|uniref:Penicillin-binding protein transpeptidase domain-containing protein n=1 Tax=Candidatus Thiomargarita nelsonii TaxID=1003181 RepID=A0A0A6PCP0_9GAMM|nr:hypothetical protein PN36_10165 [Candidatus Thiomargarita nelsonii]
MLYLKLKSFLSEVFWYLSLLTHIQKLNQGTQLKIMLPTLILLLPLLYAYGMYSYLAGEVNPAILNDYLKLHRYRTSIAIRDRDNNLIGTIPSQLESPTKAFNHKQRQGALYVENPIPPVFWEVLMAREDRYLDFEYSAISFWDIITLQKRSYKGIDIFGMPYRILQAKGGGSGLINLIIKNLKGQNYFNTTYGRGKIAQIRRKLNELQGARHLFPYLATNQGNEFQRWIAMHAPLLVASDDVYGIQAVAATLFGKKPKDLSEAEQAILAAAYLHNLRLLPSESSKLAQARQIRWDKIIRSAKEGVKNAYQDKPQKYQSIIAQLAQFQPPSEPRLPASLQGLVANKPFLKKQTYANLSRRTTKLLPGFDDLIYSPVKQFYNQLSENSILTELKITLPIQENYRFKRKVDKALTRIASHQTFNKTLVPSENSESKAADIRIVVAKLSGEIIRYYRRGEYLEENSGSQQRNGIQRNRALRRMASIAKIPAAVLLASLGDKATRSLYCNKAYQTLRNSSGAQGVTHCDKRKKQAWHTPIETFGASKNLPLRYALAEKKRTKDELMQLYQAFGIYHPSQFQARETVTAENLIHGLSFGTAEATPMQMHRLIHELTAIVYSDREPDAQAPYFIEFIKFHEGDELRQERLPFKTPDMPIKKYLKTDAAKSFIKQTLSAPVYSKKGTLRSFKQIKGVRFLLIKSGTAQTYDKRKVKDKLVVGSMEIKGEIYTFTILVGTKAEDKEGLAYKVSHSSLMMPIMREIVRSLSPR